MPIDTIPYYTHCVFPSACFPIYKVDDKSTASHKSVFQFSLISPPLVSNRRFPEMSLNAFLHPRNPYRTPPDFKALARDDAEFRSVCKTELTGKVSLDYSDREAVRVLTRVLLRRDFKLDVEIPPQALVPTLPLRMNYLLWVQDLLMANALSDSDVVGMDVGVGGACVFPLLAARHLKWKMLGTEKDRENLECARRNVERNKLTEQVWKNIIRSILYVKF